MITIDKIAEQYVKLSLKIGQHSEYYVDAYYGPADWQPKQSKTDLNTLYKDACELINDIDKIITNNTSRRVHYLYVHIKASATYINKLLGNELKFVDECAALYDVVPPTFDTQHFDVILKELDNLVPGTGDLNTRINDYRQEFVIPVDRLDAVFNAAIDEARKRTLNFIDIPSNENFNVELVNDQVWSAYNWYKGNSYSLIQLNTDHPIFIDRVIDLAAHEGYPGHHIFNVLIEKHLVNENGWMEYSIYNLFSPSSLLAEGSANYGIEVAFPTKERLQFEQSVLFPLAEINPEKAKLYYDIQAVLHKLSYVDNMVAQKYLDNEITADEAVKLLMKYALSSEERSKQRLKFIEYNRSYVINYNYGQDLVKVYLANQVTNSSHDELWRVFTELLSEPRTGSMMQV
ncbi:hypothetical protein KO527_14295 [Pseudoalteromonas sp. C2R02]|uniref:hypothetical protein n=1 Tax=Pseudoalteromonas sp. C2R02 TaxID=2841565 RepID=UPI001C0A54F8|nr:hypothetical protein [Pseudoalteromonas sp. C2R02]MBU2970521.1 hypothetical protein [Pseudoalteromonas sp. C2R02]